MAVMKRWWTMGKPTLLNLPTMNRQAARNIRNRLAVQKMWKLEIQKALFRFGDKELTKAEHMSGR